jgi:hypothetical protein
MSLMQQPKKLRTRLTIGHLLQWALGHSFRSQIGSDNLSALTQKPQFLTRSKTVHSLGGLTNNVSVSSVAADRGEFAPRQISRDELQINAVDGSRRELGLGGILNGIDLRLGANDSPGLAQSASVTDDHNGLKPVGTTGSINPGFRGCEVDRQRPHLTEWRRVQHIGKRRRYLKGSSRFPRFP